MVFSMAGFASSTTVAREPVPLPANAAGVTVDLQVVPPLKSPLHDKSDWVHYTMMNAPYIGLAGIIGGAQEAYYKFERMPPSVSRHTLRQAMYLYGIVGGKALLATAIGAVFCATDALVEQYRGKHDMTSGCVAGLVAGAAFAMRRPWPQPLVWPLAFAGVAMAADIMGEQVPATLKGYRSYGPVEGRANWGDPEPPRPPILQTGAACRPTDPGHFWRESQ